MRYLTPLLLVILLAGCGGGKNPAELRGKERFDYLFQHAKYMWSLKAGMSKDEVRAILGPPDNSDDEYIWFYTDTDVKDSTDRTWMGLLTKTHGIYYVFYNDRLILDDGVHYYRTIEGAPEQQMQHMLPVSLSQEDVNKLLNDARAKHLSPSGTSN